MPTKNKNGKFYFLDVPKVKWAKLNLLDDVAQKQFLMTLRSKMEIPHKVIAEMMDLDPDDLKQQLKDEEGSIVDPNVIEAESTAGISLKLAHSVYKANCQSLKKACLKQFLVCVKDQCIKKVNSSTA
jgi:hypothetical protein